MIAGNFRKELHTVRECVVELVGQSERRSVEPQLRVLYQGNASERRDEGIDNWPKLKTGSVAENELLFQGEILGWN